MEGVVGGRGKNLWPGPLERNVGGDVLGPHTEDIYATKAEAEASIKNDQGRRKQPFP